ncbi:MAG: endolytic transglycosylase MltG, partial [Beijerinckiaceae bacterium]
QLPPSSGDVESYPVAPGRRQEMNRNASQAGAAAGRTAPGETARAFAAQQEPDVPPPMQPRRPRAFDAVEGTAKDPLRNKTFDLNSPKTVPTLR